MEDVRGKACSGIEALCLGLRGLHVTKDKHGEGSGKSAVSLAATTEHGMSHTCVASNIVCKLIGDK